MKDNTNTLNSVIFQIFDKQIPVRLDWNTWIKSETFLTRGDIEEAQHYLAKFSQSASNVPDAMKSGKIFRDPRLLVDHADILPRGSISFIHIHFLDIFPPQPTYILQKFL